MKDEVCSTMKSLTIRQSTLGLQVLATGMPSAVFQIFRNCERNTTENGPLKPEKVP